MISKNVLDYYIDRKRRNYPTDEEIEKLNVLSEIFNYSNWIDRVGKDVYLNIMHFLEIPEDDIEKNYQEYIKMKESFPKEPITVKVNITK